MAEAAVAPTDSGDDLASLLATEVSGSEPVASDDVQEAQPDEAVNGEIAPELSIPAPAQSSELAELRAKVATLEAQRATPPHEVAAVQARLLQMEQERATERAVAEQAQRDSRIRTLKALKVQAVEAGDSVAAERYADELDDAKRERDQAAILAKLQPAQRQPEPQQVPREYYEHQRELDQWRIDNKVWDESEFQAAAAVDKLLRENPANQGKFQSNRDIWTAALNQVRGVKPGAPARPKAAYAAVEGNTARAPATPKAPVRRTAKEQQIISGLLKHGRGLITEKDFED